MADKLSAARGLLAMGDREGARRLLYDLLRTDPKAGGGEGWWLLSEVVEDASQVAECRQRAQRAGYQPAATAVPHTRPSPVVDAPRPQQFVPSPPHAAPAALLCPQCHAANPFGSPGCWRCQLPFAPVGARANITYTPERGGKSNTLRNVLLGIIALVLVGFCAIPRSPAVPAGGGGFVPNEKRVVWDACVNKLRAELESPDVAPYSDGAVIKDPQKEIWLVAGEVDERGTPTQEWICGVYRQGDRYVVNGIEYVDK